MRASKSGVTLLKHFSQNESKLATLYTRYSERFPEINLFGRLANDEKRHAAYLLDLDERFHEEALAWPLSENAPLILEYISNFIDEYLERVSDPGFSLEDALDSALSLEQSMIEKKTFTMFKTDNPEIIAVLEKLNLETDKHWQAIAKYKTKDI